jgi:hypothetical protein
LSVRTGASSEVFEKPARVAALLAAGALSIGCPLAVEDDYVIRSQDAGAGTGGSGGSGSGGKGGVTSGGNGGTSSAGTGGQPPTCSDDKRSVGETDVDCGGMCDPCEDGLACKVDRDCASEHCDSEKKKCAESD